MPWPMSQYLSTVNEILFISALNSPNNLKARAFWPGEGSVDQGSTGSNLLGQTLSYLDAIPKVWGSPQQQ